MLERGLALQAERRPLGRATPRLAPLALHGDHPEPIGRRELRELRDRCACLALGFGFGFGFG